LSLQRYAQFKDNQIKRCVSSLKDYLPKAIISSPRETLDDRATRNNQGEQPIALMVAEQRLFAAADRITTER
jgi:hypothetical protein